MKKNNYIKRICIWVNVLDDFFKSFKGCSAKILNSEETVKYILDNKKSIIRLGDGEFNILNGKDISYQKYSKQLKEELNNVLELYFKSKGDCEYLLCVPKYFMECSGFKLMKKRIYIASWAYSREQFQKNFPQDILYGDAFLFKRENEEIYEKIWVNSNYKTCVFIHNDKKYAEKFENEYNIKTKFIKINSRNAYEQINDIKLKVLDYINEDRKNVIVLISAGPAGKILVKDLSRKGIFSIDTGHCWDNPLII